MVMEADINHRTYLGEQLKKRFPTFNFHVFWEMSEGITQKQYKYLLALYYQESPDLESKLIEFFTHKVIKNT